MADNLEDEYFEVIMDPRIGADTSSGSSSPTFSDSESNEGTAVPVVYDTGLPVSHNYLGENLEELRGRTIFDDLSYQVLPLLQQPGVVLMPSQTLPLLVFNAPTVEMLRNLTTTNGTFGLVCVSYFDTPEQRMAMYGTTAEIYEYRDVVEQEGFRMKAKGRQRFRIMETRRSEDGNLSGTVRILPEVVLPDSLHAIRQQSLDRYRGHPADLQLPLPLTSQHRLNRRRAMYQRDAMMTAFPHWIHNLYNASSVAQQVRSQLSHLTLSSAPIRTKLPSDPVELSFWVAQIMPFKDEEKIALLRVNSAIQRLRWEIKILQSCTMYCCRFCELDVADPKDTFSMSLEGPKGTYVNPGGYLHEILTVLKAKGLRCINIERTIENSWFPGYAWTIAECRRCTAHMGWKFTASNHNLKPSKFWGICRSAIVTMLVAGDVIPKL